MSEQQPKTITLNTINSYFRSRFAQPGSRPSETISIGDITGSRGDRRTYAPVFVDFIANLVGDQVKLKDPSRIAIPSEPVKTALVDLYTMREAEPDRFTNLRPELGRIATEHQGRAPFIAVARQTAAALSEVDHDAGIILDDIILATGLVLNDRARPAKVAQLPPAPEFFFETPELLEESA